MHISQRPHYALRPVEDQGMARQDWFDHHKRAVAWIKDHGLKTYWSGVRDKRKAEAAARKATEASGIAFEVRELYSISL